MPRLNPTTSSTDLCTSHLARLQTFARGEWITFHRMSAFFGVGAARAYIPLRRRTRKCTAKLENGSRNGDRLLDSDGPAKQLNAGRAEAGGQRLGSNPRDDPKGRLRPPGTNAFERTRQADRVRVAASDVSPREERVLRSAMRRTQCASAARKRREGHAILGTGSGRSCYTWQGHA